MRPLLCLLLAAVVLTPAAPALAAGEPTGGTGVPAAGPDGGALADPYHGVADEPAATIAAASGEPAAAHPARPAPGPDVAAGPASTNGPASAKAADTRVALRPAAATATSPATSMPNTGFDLGAMVAIGLLLLGCGLGLLACAGPAPRRAVRA